jgi:beta-glucosidase
VRPLSALLGFAIACGDPSPAPLADAGTDAAPDGGAPHVPDPFEPTAATIAYCGERDDAAIEARITTMLSELTLGDKIALMSGAGMVDGSWRVEGNEALDIAGLRMLDGPRGVSAFRGLGATAFPVAMLRGATFDPELERRVGAAIAVELRSVGADTLLAPTINLLRHPRWGRAQETYSEDTHHMGEMGVAFIEGVQSEGVLATAKHFAANSIEDTRHTVDVTVDERTLREIYLPHFERAVNEARVASVMSAYNKVNGFYCDMQQHLLGDILKGEWQFSGYVVSDWIAGTHSDVESVRAGLDIEMPTNPNFAMLARRVRTGEIDEHEIDGAVRRILRAQLCFGLDEREVTLDDPTLRNTAEHRALAREVARRGIVLLKNAPPEGEAAPVLPLDAAAIRSIAVLGRNADVENIGDTGSSAVMPEDVITALEGLTAVSPEIDVQHVATLDAAGEAIVRAAGAVVIVTGLAAEDEGEASVGAGDRASLAVPAEEVALIRAVAAIHPAVIVVLEAGAALLTSEFDGEIEALLFAFYPGVEGGNAIAELLFGESPSGRLPFSIPERESDLPPFDNTSLEVTYGYFHGYRHLDHEEIAPRYPFGFGLSYGAFEYADLRLSSATIAPGDTLEATVRVTNGGAVRAIETVQLYVSARSSRVERAPADLRSFAQVELAPGESDDVTLTVRADDLAFYDVAAGAFELEAIEYEARVGSHCGDARLSATFRAGP